jgi:hypothetical protein
MNTGRGRRGRFALLALGAMLVALAAAPAAQATFHLIKVREVHAGAGDDSYVELQMFAAGQTFLGGHAMTVYGSTGALTHTSTFSTGVAAGENQRAVLIGDSGVEAKFGVKPDLVDPSLAIPAAGGAVCWNAGGIPADCVAWGNFSGGAALQSATGTSAGSPASPAGITTGKAIRRSIAQGCPTLLEESDDSNSSVADFAEVAPAPRNDATVPTEKTCAGAPETAIDDKPALNSNTTSASFTYEAPTATSYECKLDSGAFASCPNTGVEYIALADGSHTFQVRGVNVSGPDPTPASFTWKVDTAPPTTTIDTHPVDPSPGKTAAFGFHASETGAKFECSLAAGAAADAFSACTSGKAYSSLVDGSYTFKVRATDLASNQQLTPTAFTWQVDNSLADTTPPQTTIVSRPPDPSPSPAASFTYASDEAGSSFECALDAGAFAPCAAAGITYAGLANGPHSFQVRAIDPSANVDPSPAGYSFSVAVAVAPPPPSPVAPVAPRPTSAAPQTTISGKPAAKTRDRTPTFRFRSDIAGASFQCAVDKQPFKACRSPFTTKTLSLGAHAVSVRAVAAGVTDPSPGKFSFKVVKGR